jgi:hypothetical protein
MNHFTSHAYGNGQFFCDVHSALRIANQPFSAGNARTLLLLFCRGLSTLHMRSQ